MTVEVPGDYNRSADFPHGYFANPKTLQPLKPPQVPVHVAWLADGRKCMLLKDVVYVDPEGGVWTAYKGSIVNGLSIPRFFWRVLGSPYTGVSRDGSVIHDVACEDKPVDSPRVHWAFYHAMRCRGEVVVRAWGYWSGVYPFRRFEAREK